MEIVCICIPSLHSTFRISRWLLIPNVIPVIRTFISTSIFYHGQALNGVGSGQDATGMLASCGCALEFVIWSSSLHGLRQPSRLWGVWLTLGRCLKKATLKGSDLQRYHLISSQTPKSKLSSSFSTSSTIPWLPCSWLSFLLFWDLHLCLYKGQCSIFDARMQSVWISDFGLVKDSLCDHAAKWSDPWP